jgi:exopolysaccharide production protein ExoQ
VLKRLEWIFHSAVLILQWGAIMPLLLNSTHGPADLGAANPLNTISNVIVLAMVLLLHLRHARATLRYTPALWLILGLLVLAFASTFWSEYPDITLRRASSLATGALWAWYVAVRYDLSDVVRLFAQTLAFLALTSLAIAIAIPGIGGADPLGPDGWRGVFATKNDLGAAMSIGAATYIYLLTAREQRLSALLLRLAGLACCLTLLYLSESRTSWVLAMVAPIICIVNRLMHRRIAIGIIIWTIFILILAPGTVLLAEQLSVIAPMLGRDATLTGRADLWAMLPAFISERPWLGYGYGGFWVESSPRVDFIWNAIGWAAPHSHNGWLDVLLDLGIVGLTIMAVQLLLVLVKTIRAVIAGHEPDAQFLMLMTVGLLINNLAESSLVRPGQNWVTLVMSVVFLARIAAERAAGSGTIENNRFQGRERFAFGPSAMANR